MTIAGLRIEVLTAPPGPAELEALGEILHACVHDGASVGFVLPFSRQAAREFWTGAVWPALETGERRLFLARLDGEVVGTAQLCLAAMPNQTHRADVSKVLVHPAAQRRGIGRALMQTVEATARAERRTLLTLDTLTGDKAEGLYAGLGFELAGRIPDYARDTRVNELRATSVMFKRLAPA
ncbi:MAG: GNAT family N-acetyltransferase [Phenylobacterium sp.]|uniref:GNAT family N-acetyltransferase n=1 Tax=Phenylobacterium sp. TaxID=1871053 RepID=UPI00391D74E5